MRYLHSQISTSMKLSAIFRLQISQFAKILPYLYSYIVSLMNNFWKNSWWKLANAIFALANFHFQET